VDSSEVLADEAAALTQDGFCDVTTGLGDVTRELDVRVKSFVERLDTTALILDHTRQCYQLIDKVLHLLFASLFSMSYERNEIRQWPMHYFF